MEAEFLKENLLTIYKDLGFEDRYDYFTTLSNKFKIPVMTIILKAEELGIECDFSDLLDWIEKQQNGII